MKRKNAAALLLAASLLTGAAAIAADAGSPGDPLITLSWLKSAFLPDAAAQARDRVDAGMDGLAQSLAPGTAGTELRLKRGDVLRLETGSGLTPLAGSLTGSSAGAIVDLTGGTELATGAALTPKHRYLVGEKTSAGFSVTSDTAVARISGPYVLSPSTETDYNALADALKALGLFRGTDTPYGSGYDLEAPPTRIQGLILFLRLMGEEQAALAYSSGVSFADVPAWALPYVAYAYDRGYTKGVAADGVRVWFGSNDPLTADHYATFLLRALSYQEAQDFNWSTAAHDAKALGVLTAGEEALLTGDRPFLRAQTVYLSYVALSAQIKGEGRTLLDRLLAAQAVPADAPAILAAVTVKRL